MVASSNQQALITGASSGIGKATALLFAEAGFDLALVSRSSERLEDVALAAQEKGVVAKAYPLDLADVAQIRPRMEAIAADFGAIDVLINNAGMGYTGDLLETPLSAWQHVLDLNLTSVFQCVQAIVPGMRDRRRGTIINVASIAGYQAFPGWGAYNVSKAGLIMLSKTLAAEERPNGIRVVIISPGSVNTPIWDTDTVQADFDRASMLTPETVAQTVLYAALLPASAVIEELTIMPSAGAF